MSVRKSGLSWGVRFHIRRRYATKGAALAFQARVESLLAEAERQQRDDVRPCCSIGSKLEEFLSDSRVGLGRRPCGWKTLQRHRRRLELFDDAFQHKPLNAIERRRLERWVKSRLALGVSPDTVNCDLVSLRAFARWAMKKGYAPGILPIMLVNRLHSPGKLAGTNRMPPPAREMGEAKRIIAAVKRERPDMGLFLIGMGLFGMRPAAVAAWKREHVTLPRAGETGRLMTRGLKGGLPRPIALPHGTPRAAWARKCLALGRRMGKDRSRDPLVPCLGDRSARNPGGWTTESFDMALTRVSAKLHLGLTAYQIRHTCVSWLQTQKDISLANTQGYAGHAVITTQNAYSHRHNRDAEAAYRLMEEEMGELI